MGYGVINSDLITTSDGVSSAGLYGLKNRLINGDMRIDQRNAGSSVTPTNGQYSVDRWQLGVSQTSKLTVQQNAGSVTPPVGFSKYVGVTSSSAYSVLSTDAFQIQQWIEGYNIADLAFGTANAATVTLSFWVRSSLTGAFGGVCWGYNGSAFRSYPFTYTISSANTWEQKTITIPGDTTTFAYNTTNGNGISVTFSLGAGASNVGTANTWQSGQIYAPTGSTSVVGTNGATFYITGVQLEKGSTATSFDYLDYGRSLIQCQRYYWKGASSGLNFGSYTTGAVMSWSIGFPVTLRSSPTLSSSLTGITYSGCSSLSWAVPSVNAGRLLVVSTTTATNCSFTWGASDYIDASSEL
jgi:hypothetical protein